MKEHTIGAMQLMHRIKVGPPIDTIHQGNSFMVTTAEAEITPDAELGMFAQDTRLISLYRLWIDRGRWALAASAPFTSFSLPRSPPLMARQNPERWSFAWSEQCQAAGSTKTFEVKRHQIPARECETSWNAKTSQWNAHYRREDFERALIYRVQKADSKPRKLLEPLA